MKALKALLSLALLATILAACGQQTTPTATPIPVEISLRAEPEALAVGSTTLIVRVTDLSGTPIDGAVLQVHGDMDHEGMAPIDREVNESVSGDYRVPFEWSMGGGWIVTVTARLPNDGGEVSERFDVFVEAISSESIINRPTSTSVSAINIAYQPDHDPVKYGDAVVMISLTDPDGAPITDAGVTVTGDMGHTGMMPSSGTGEHVGGGQYRVPLRWTMVGEWIVTVSVTLSDGSYIEQVFTQQVVIE
ncbi:MAG: FixH family protein [Anaerolineae bacterium]|jgi:nitrogen fixation protein FixH|nr:FixH family protein [Anaerolineae bacterium]